MLNGNFVCMYLMILFLISQSRQNGVKSIHHSSEVYSKCPQKVVVVLILYMLDFLFNKFIRCLITLKSTDSLNQSVTVKSD